MTAQSWRVTWFPNRPGVVHVSPTPDQFLHHTEIDAECWCGAWKEYVGGGVVVHHLNLTQRIEAPQQLALLTGAQQRR